MNQLDILLQKIKLNFDGKKYDKFIHDVTFPNFKKFRPHEKITFRFPVTLLVGPNGGGKSSILHALWGMPHGNSTSKYWFSTAVDPISEEKNGKPNVPRYWYTHQISQPKAMLVETRKVKGTKRLGYWEPSKPSTGDGMQPMPAGAITPFRSTDRWTATKRNVKYINTKVDTSAFDRFFYYSEVAVLQEKQEKFVNESERLRNVIDNDLKSKKIGRGEFVFDNYIIPKNSIDVINKILGKHYVSARYIIHRFYDRNKAASVIFETSSHTYSESFAGSGELAVVNLVLEIEKLSDNDLLLLDEPETSLHPGAQKALLEYILRKTDEKKLQVVISTHSSTLVDLVPDEALVVLEHDEAGIYVRPDADKSSAFYRLGQSDPKKITILTEDILLKAMVERALSKLGRHIQDRCTVVSSATGVSEMLSHQAHAFMQAHANVILVLDGDQQNYMALLDTDPTNISVASAKELYEKFQQCNVKLIGIDPDVASYIKWCKFHVLSIDEICPEYVFMRMLEPAHPKLATANNKECKKLLRNKLKAQGDDGDSAEVAAIFKYKLGEHSEVSPTKDTLDSLAKKISDRIAMFAK